MDDVGPKKERKSSDPVYTPSPGVIYKPCTLCGSDDYDNANGDVDDELVFEPTGCDVCNFGHPKTGRYIVIH